MNAAPPLTNVQARDVEALVHPYTPLHRLKEIGPLVIQRGKGIYVYDTQGKPYIEGMSGLWCTGLGYGDEELIEAATEQLRTLSYTHLFGAKSTELIQELVNVKALEGGYPEVARMVHGHPTLSEAVMEAARAADGWLIHG